MRILITALLVLAVGCPSTPDTGVEPTPEPVNSVDFGVSIKGDLKMKRWRQISRDLEAALLLPPEAVCNETGLYPCTNLHAVPLGGISIDNGLFRAVDTVSVTTGLAFERFVLAACWERLRRDSEEEETPLVFTIPMDETTLDTEAGSVQVVDLYRRLLGRDPTTDETEAVLAIHPGIIDDGGRNGEWATMACFAIGTTTEGLLY